MDYLKIAECLDLSIEDDIISAEILNELITSREDFIVKLTRIEGMIKDRAVVVFGAGPSLEKDVENIVREGLQDKCVLIAADGATKALLCRKLVPDIVVTDLDGDIKSIMKADLLGSVIVVHAHGDNIHLLREYVPMFKRIIGTTQVCPIGKLHNFGGFTDGDRSVFLAANFNPRIIGLCGMDFGKEIGEYSGDKDKEVKIKKLQIGKMLLDELSIDHKVVNLTEKSELNIEKTSFEEFATLLRD